MAERYGDFELLRLIATGGMAEIYLAKVDSFGGFTRQVVVKRMLPQLAVRPDFVQMFLDEARLAANLNHPNIVQVFNLGEVDQSYFIAMELVDGPHLGTLFAHSLRMRKALPVELCAYIVARAADGLHYAHEHADPATGSPLNIVHRDISPQNILVSRQGDVKVTDFGVAKASTQQTKTRTGIIKGKVAYMSPEQCLGEVVDRRTDVFALGIVLYELITRRRLFRDKSDLLIMQKITGEDVAAPSTLNKELDAELDTIALRALTRSREARFSSAAELGEALDAWLATRSTGDVRAQLERWVAQNALELTFGDNEGSQPSLETARVRPPAGEATAATPSLNSAETVMRPNSVSSASAEPASSPKVRPSLQAGARAEELLPTRGAIEDEPTQRAPRPSVSEQETMRGVPSPRRAQPGGEAPRVVAEVTAPGAEPTSISRGPDLDGALPEIPDAAPARRLPFAAIGGVAALAALAMLVVLVRGSGSSDLVIADAGSTAIQPTTGSDTLPTVVPAPPAVDGKPAHLVLQALPPVEILLDGKSLGKAPVTVEHAPGHVKLQALFDDQPPVTEELDVTPGEERTVRLLAKVPLVVKSTPPGARIKVDGIAEGLTPFERAGRLAPEQPVKLRVEALGFIPFEKMLTPEPGAPLVLDVMLEKARSGGNVPAGPVTPSRPGTLKMRSTPWVNVKVAGSSQKFSTPNAVQIPSGRQTLVLQNPESGINDQLVVVIPEDKELRVDLVYEQQKNGTWKLKQKQIR